MRCLVYDLETRSTLSLPQVGSHIYSCGPTTDVWCLSWCIVTDGIRGPISTWVRGDPAPAEFPELAADPDAATITFNDVFEQAIELRILNPRYGFPVFPIERRRCMQAVSLAHALPASLDKVAGALRLKTRKTVAGKRAMKALATPRKPRKGEDPTKGPYWHDDPKKLETLYEYNREDVAMTADILERLGFLSPGEEAIWQLNGAVNSRGIGIDVGLLDAALDIVLEADAELREKLAALTDGEITSPAQVQRLLAWLKQRGCALDNIQRPTVLEALKQPELAPQVKELLGLRLDGAHAAAKKLQTLRRWTGSDQRIRHTYRYHGAMPGRFTSIGAQMQNLKKPAVEDIAGAIAAVRTGSLTQVQAQFERPLSIIGDITRALVVAAPGHRLFIADLSGIESRGLAWICNEQAKLEQWREFDRTGDSKLEPYYLLGQDFGLGDSVARKAGKVGDLAFQYQGGIGAWRRLAPSGDTTSDERVRSHQQTWRRRHPNIMRFWGTAIRQAVNAIESGPCERFTVARIAFQRDTRFLHMVLPSGRRIRYPNARAYANETGSKSFTFRDAGGGRWEWYHVLKKRGVFGGLVAENATQAICRDLFVEGMLRLEAAGYRLVAHNHDEFVAEVPDGFGSLEEFISIITQPPAWAPDFPIAAKGRVADRWIEIKEIGAASPPDEEAQLDQGQDEEDETGEEPETEPDELDIVPAAGATTAPSAEPAVEPAIGTVASVAFMLTRAMKEQLRARGFSEEDIHNMTPQEGHSILQIKAAPTNGSATEANGHAGEDHTPGGNGHPAGNGSDYAAGEEQRGAPVSSYIYKDARGYLFMRVLRTSSKTFPTQHWHDGRWTNGWPKGPVIPYRLPELLATPASEPVWICEGEKDANNVAALGLIATTNPGGAAKWQPELAQWFNGRDLVYLLEDNDEAGRNNTRIITAALREVVAHTVPVAFPELPEKGDVSDWLEQGGTKQLLLARAEEARKKLKNSRSYTLVALHAMPMEATDWVWEGHLIRGELELLSGLPGIGKTQVQCQLIACTSAGHSWPDGQKGPSPGHTIIITAEDKAQDYLKRLFAAGADLNRVKMLKYVRRNNRDEMFLLSEDLDKLEQAILDLGDVNLVAIDPITAFMGSGKQFDSHRATDVRSRLGPLALLAEKLNVAFSAVTHPPKNASQRAMDHFIGSQAYIAAARVGHICVDEMLDTGDGTRQPSGRKLFATPKHTASSEPPTLAYRIEPVKLGWDAKRERDIITSVIRWEGPVELTADEALAAGRPGKVNRNSARQFLLDILAGGPVPQAAISERGAEHGFSYDQLWRAKQALGVRAFKKRGEGLDSSWLWALPQHVPAGVKNGLD